MGSPKLFDSSWSQLSTWSIMLTILLICEVLDTQKYPFLHSSTQTQLEFPSKQFTQFLNESHIFSKCQPNLLSRLDEPTKFN